MAFYQKCESAWLHMVPSVQQLTACGPLADVDEQSKTEIKNILLQYDRTLLVADPRRCEPKKCAC